MELQNDSKTQPDHQTDSSSSKYTLFGSKLTSALSKMDLEHCEPEFIINMLKTPSVKIFSSLQKKLKTAGSAWVEDFMDLGGFEILFDLIETLSNKRVTKLTDAMLLMENIACIKAIMNSRSGMEYFIMHPESGKQLIKALDTNNVMVKKQVLELFSAITAFSKPGYHMTINSLESYKLNKKKRYRFSVLLNEIQQHKEVPFYWTTLLAFINCLILANEDLYERVQIRNEFVGLRLLEILDELKDLEDEDLLIQCDVFFNEMHNDDDEMSNLSPECIDLNSHKQVFDTILQKVCDKPQSSSFLTLLQCLMYLESDGNSETQWLIIEDLVRKAVYGDKKDVVSSNFELNDDYSHLVMYDPCENNSHFKSLTSGCTSGYKSVSVTSSISSGSCSFSNIPLTISTPKEQTIGGGVKDAGNLSTQMNPPPDFTAADMPSVLLTPKPKSIMKTLNWSKVSMASATKKKVVWSDILHIPDPIPVKYDEIEDLFANHLQTLDANENIEKTPISMVSLMDTKKMLEVNILLKQFNLPVEGVIELLKKGDEKEIGTERLKALIKIIPEGEELEMLTIFEGNTKLLNTAEKFCLDLIKIPEYAISLEVMLLKCEFGLVYRSVLPLLEDIILTCRKLMGNKSLKEFLRFVLHTGNFINAGGYIGGALGFKISSLPKLMEIRSNKPKMTLLHYLVEELEKENRHVMEFVEELSPLLEKTYWLSLPGLKGQVEILCSRVKSAEDHLLSCSEELNAKCAAFMQQAKSDLDSLLSTLNETYEVKDQLANHFCEEAATFRLEHCLETYKNLCGNIKKCKKENMKRLSQEENSKKKKKEQKNSNENKIDKPRTQDDDSSIIEKLLNNIKSGKSMRRVKKSCI